MSDQLFGNMKFRYSDKRRFKSDDDGCAGCIALLILAVIVYGLWGIIFTVLWNILAVSLLGAAPVTFPVAVLAVFCIRMLVAGLKS